MLTRSKRKSNPDATALTCTTCGLFFGADRYRGRCSQCFARGGSAAKRGKAGEVEPSPLFSQVLAQCRVEQQVMDRLVATARASASHESAAFWISAMHEAFDGAGRFPTVEQILPLARLLLARHDGGYPIAMMAVSLVLDPWNIRDPAFGFLPPAVCYLGRYGEAAEPATLDAITHWRTDNVRFCALHLVRNKSAPEPML